MDAVLSSWPLMGELKTFCTTKFAQPFTKDLWTQISRFVRMTHDGLDHFTDDGGAHSTRPKLLSFLCSRSPTASPGPVSAWPSAIDDFVEQLHAAGDAR